MDTVTKSGFSDSEAKEEDRHPVRAFRSFRRNHSHARGEPSRGLPEGMPGILAHVTLGSEPRSCGRETDRPIGALFPGSERVAVSGLAYELVRLMPNRSISSAPPVAIQEARISEFISG